MMKIKDRPIYKEILNRYKMDTKTFMENMVKRAIKNKEIREDIPQDFITKYLTVVFLNSTEMIETDNLLDIKPMDYLIEILKSGLKSA